MHLLLSRRLLCCFVFCVFLSQLHAQQSPPVIFTGSVGTGNQQAIDSRTSGGVNFQDGFATYSGSFGATSASLSYKLELIWNNATIGLNGRLDQIGIARISAYVRGNPGTSFHLTGQQNATIAASNQNCFDAAAEIGSGSFEVEAFPGQSIHRDATPINVDVTGTTSGNPIVFQGQTYSLAYSFSSGFLDIALQAGVGGIMTCTSSVRGAINFTVSGNTTTNSIHLLSVNDTDPNNPVVSFAVMGNVGLVNWGLDGNVSNSLGAPSAGTITFTVPNIKALVNSLHVLEVIGTSNGTTYADSTQLDTSIIADQSFSNTWQILVTNLSFDELPHNNVKATGAIHKCQVVWGIPGQQYDRFLASVSTVLNSFLPADAPNSFTTVAIPNLQIAGYSFIMKEVPSIGNSNYWGAAFGNVGGGPLPVGLFAKSGQTPATFRLNGTTYKKGNNLYWSGAAWFFFNLNVYYGSLNFVIN